MSRSSRSSIAAENRFFERLDLSLDPGQSNHPVRAGQLDGPLGHRDATHVATAAILALRQLARTSAPIAEQLPLLGSDTADSLRHDHIVSYRLDGALFFGAVQQFLAGITTDGDVRVVILRLPELQVLDATGAQAIGELIEELETNGTTVLLKGPRTDHLRLLTEIGAIDRLAHHNHLFDELDAAITHARGHASRAVAPHEQRAVRPNRV